MNNKLVWAATEEPNDKIRYHHTVAETPFGRILITWKEWKIYTSYDIEEFPGCDTEYRDTIICLDSSNTESAKIEAEEKYIKWLEEAYKESKQKTVNLAIELIKYTVK